MSESDGDLNFRSLWPTITTEAELDELKPQQAKLLPAVRVLFDHLGMRPGAIRPFSGGSLPVYGTETAGVLKLFPGPAYVDSRLVEGAVLGHLGGSPLSPRLLGLGVFEGWGYVLMSQVPGRALGEVWSELDASSRGHVAADLGAWLRELHSRPTTDLDLPEPSWRGFLSQQQRGVVERQRALGLDAGWLDRIGPFLETIEPPLTCEREVLLHTEIMREHVFVVEHSGRWRLSGVIDFEPSMLGDREYEFASVGLFAAGGNSVFLRTLLEAYGYGERDLDEGLRMRFMAYALLHKYAHLGWYLRNLPPAPGVRSLEGLASQWWAW